MFAGAIRTSTSNTSFKNRAGNCILITIAVICVCILVTCGVMIVREYVLGIGYLPAVCKVANVTVSSEFLPCSYCDMKKKSKEKGKGTCEQSYFPCAQVNVNYTRDGSKFHGLLHQDSLQAIGKYSKCSYNVCLRLKQENEKKVREFAAEWRKKVGLDFPCFYNVDNHGLVIKTKKHSKDEVIHSMLWPSVVIIICGAIFLKLEMDRRRLTCCGQQDEVILDKSLKQDGRSCNGKNDLFPQSTGGGRTTSGSKVHRSLEHLSNYSTNKADYHSTCSKSLSCLDHLGVNGHTSKQPSSKQHLLKPSHIQASCSETGIIENKVLKCNSDQGQCLIPEITINDFGTTESLHHETPV